MAFVPRAGRRSTVVGRVPLVLEIACRRDGRAGADPGHLPGEPGSSVQGGGGQCMSGQGRQQTTREGQGAGPLPDSGHSHQVVMQREGQRPHRPPKGHARL